MTVETRRLGSTTDLLGESPCWDAARGCVWWIDSLGGHLRRHFPADAAGCAHALPAPVGSIAVCRDGHILVALKDRFAKFDPDTNQLRTLGIVDVDHPDVRLNDGKCDPWGNFIAGTLQVHWKPGQPVHGGLFRLRATGGVELLETGFALTNGPCFSPEGRTLYVADSAIGVRTIWAFDYAPDGPLANRRVFARTESLGAGPDGATVDADGCVWTMLPRVGKLARFTPRGAMDALVALPMTHPTSLCFGGKHLDRLYVTSISRSTNLSGTQPQDGGLFELTGLGARGVAPHVFGG